MKRTVTLLVILIGIILVINIVDKISKTRTRPDLFKGFNKGEVTQITLSKRNGKETLKKENNQWIATEQGNYPADTSKINEILDMIADQKKTKPRSKNPEKHKELKLDSAGAIKVIVEGGKTFTFFLGSMAQGFKGNYLRFDGKNEVYVTSGNMERLFSTRPNHFRNKRLFNLNKDNVNEFTVMYKEARDKDTTVAVIAAKFDHAGGNWKIDKPETADGDIGKINEYLGKFADLEVDDWYDKDTAAAPGFHEPFLKADFKNSDGTTKTVIVGNEKGGDRYIKVENDNNKYLIRKHKVDQLKKKLEDLKAPEKKEADTAKTDLNVTVPGTQGISKEDKK